MGSVGRPLVDLNELPAVEDDEADSSSCFQPQRAIPSSNIRSSNLFVTSPSPQRIVNNHAFSHASLDSGSQTFVCPKSPQRCLVSDEHMEAGDMSSEVASLLKACNEEDAKSAPKVDLSSAEVQVVEKEEGEWSDAEDSATGHGSSCMQEQPLTGCRNEPQEKGIPDMKNHSVLGTIMGRVSQNSRSIKDENSNHISFGLNRDTNDGKNNTNQNIQSNCKGDITIDFQEETGSVLKQRKVKGVEALHALKCANNPGKRSRFDQHKEALLGKKRSRQTMFLNLEDVKQAGPIKTSTPKRQNFPAAITKRTVKDAHSVPPAESTAEKQNQHVNKDLKHVDLSCNEGNNYVESNDSKSECNGDMNSGILDRPRRLNSSTFLAAEVILPSISRQCSWKQPLESRQVGNSQISTRKSALTSHGSIDPKLSTQKLPPKKPAAATRRAQCQDTSVERLLREVTNEKLWHHPGEADLQCVPARFESAEEYVKVFEPLLFEECRAQLYSTWEELIEAVSWGLHIMVRVKSVERRERGWYDVTVLPAKECKWAFKDGDVAILSTPRPGKVGSKGSNTYYKDDDGEPEVSGRVAGTIRRYMPIGTRDSLRVILHFYVGDSYDLNSKVDNDHILRKVQARGIWFLTVLGSLATTQREYVALHAFQRLNLQMQTAILQPSPEHFPKYDEQHPTTPESFTPNFVDYLSRTFNVPQLAAIQWAAMHTAAGTSSVMKKKEDPWPFTLVEGPPGTGKTHTVWGMLNVIHLVQYQHYYSALLKKLAPDSYKKTSESNFNNVATGSIDEVLQSMDQNLLCTLPNLSTKPRMLVCAPSNAATDELLTRVLDRGFIDGEMKVYRPDVARVGVDSQTRAAQAVSVECRTEQLLVKSRDEIYGWMHQLRAREAQLSQQIACLRRELNLAAAACCAQGSVGVDPGNLVTRDQNRDSLLQKLAAVVENRDKILVEISRLLILEGKFRVGGNFNLNEARANLEASFANEAEIVFTTVSSSGRKLFSRLTHGFDMVVIDEAAQASEVAILPPLCLGVARCVLVGDPQQLPATVISKAAGSLLYNRSLFERFQQAGCPTILLSVQYRMHPQIRDFPSRYFYKGHLTDSESVARLPDEICYMDPLLRPYVFYDISHGRESRRGGSVSYQNVHEARFCLSLWEHLQKTLRSLGMGKVSVGIITPYKLQLKCLQREFEDVLNSEGKNIYINTVDAFQGQERDVIIMSCVRASNHGVGFVADIRRMNVALTRARRALWVVGNANTLVQSDDWSALIADAKSRNCYKNMVSLPKDFLIPRTRAHAQLPGKVSSNPRGFRSGVRHRSFDMQTDPSSGTPSEADEKPNASVICKNGKYRH